MTVRTPATDANGTTPTFSSHAPDAFDQELRTRVTISRAHPEDCQQRQIVARLDDGAPVTLMYGEAFTEDVRPGSHVLRAHNTLFRKRIAFQVEAGEHLEFIIVNRAGAATLSLLALLGVAPLYMTIERRSLA
ncbi:MAG TPA: hypothetical protein VG538_16935 [Vicinamibacterales bacterium]|nr:hypothetical protein [Vicinamibacterales bacterium]